MDTIVPILLLVALVPGAHGQSRWEGRKSCFTSQYPYSKCCGEGPKGSCWYGNVNYDT